MDEISIEQLENGCEKALENAEDLLTESKLLLKNKRWARAFFLASIAVEELGKHIIIKTAQARVVYGNQNWRNFWQRLRDHKDKKRLFLHIEYLFSSTSASEYLQKLDNETHQEGLIKLASLYTDFYEKEFLNPMDLMNEEMASEYVKLAEHRLENVKGIHEKTKGVGFKLKKENLEKFYELTGLKEFMDNQ